MMTKKEWVSVILMVVIIVLLVIVMVSKVNITIIVEKVCDNKDNITKGLNILKAGLLR